MKLRREAERLTALFERAIVLAAAGTGLVACTASSTPAAAADAGDASTTSDAADAIPDFGPKYAWPMGCEPRQSDAGDKENDCIFVYDLPCGVPDGYPVGEMPAELCRQICPLPGANPFICGTVENTPDAGDETGDAASDAMGDAMADAMPDAPPAEAGRVPGQLACAYCSTGRRPVGLATPAHVANPRGLGEWLAGGAELESAAVIAFSDLRRELSAARAPRSLLRAASRARRDEIRHARLLGALSRRRGVAPGKVCSTSRRRSLEVLALENAVEGCVRETFGAAVATFQAKHAPDGSIAAAFRRIARDETRHAALARCLARFFDARLSRAARSRVRAAVAHARTTLRMEIETAWLEVPSAGLPSRETALRLCDATLEDVVG